MDRIESPPSSKKLSWMPTRSVPRTSAQMAAMAFSAGVRGATYSAGGGGRRPGAGRARRSTLPLGVSGQRVQAVKADGDHVVGQLRRSAARSSARRAAAAAGGGTT